jgi:hypothetical protein
LFAVLTVLCLAGGWWCTQAFRQRAAVLRFYELTAQRVAANGHDDLVTMGYRHDGKDQYYKPILSPWQRWLASFMGEECFGEVTGVQLIDTPATDDDLRLLRHVASVERVWLSGTKVTDAGLEHLACCSQLKFLGANNTAITDAGAAIIARHRNLESLSLSDTHITDEGLAELAKLPHLKELWLHNTPITDDGYNRLQAALPDCQIQADTPSYQRKIMSLYWNTGSPIRD